MSDQIAQITFDQLPANEKKIVARMVRYQAVNGAWPKRAHELPKPTGQEAIDGVRQLLKFCARHYEKPKLAKGWKYRLASGNRYTWPRGDVWAVNPDRHGDGWHEIVHSVSHWVHPRVYAGRRPHDGTHAMVEKMLIEHVVNSGWLDGTLKKPVKEKPPVDIKAVRSARVLQKLKAWESKKRRAETAIKKLKRQAKYYGVAK